MSERENRWRSFLLNDSLGRVVQDVERRGRRGFYWRIRWTRAHWGLRAAPSRIGSSGHYDGWGVARGWVGLGGGWAGWWVGGTCGRAGGADEKPRVITHEARGRGPGSRGPAARGRALQNFPHARTNESQPCLAPSRDAASPSPPCRLVRSRRQPAVCRRDAGLFGEAAGVPQQQPSLCASRLHTTAEQHSIGWQRWQRRY